MNGIFEKAENQTSLTSFLYEFNKTTSLLSSEIPLFRYSVKIQPHSYEGGYRYAKTFAPAFVVALAFFK